MQRSSGVLVGQKGVKYGLQTRGPKGATQPAQAGKPIAVFGDDSDSDNDVAAQVARQAATKHADVKVQQQ